MDDLIVASLEDLRGDCISFLQLTCTLILEICNIVIISSHELSSAGSNADWDINKENSKAELTGTSDSLQHVLPFELCTYPCTVPLHVHVVLLQ